MVVGLGKNTLTGRDVVLITLNEQDVMRLIAEGIELSQDVHHGFPANLEVALCVVDDEEAANIGKLHNPHAAIIIG